MPSCLDDNVVVQWLEVGLDGSHLVFRGLWRLIHRRRPSDVRLPEVSQVSS